MGELIEEVKSEEMLNAIKKPDTEGLIEFVKLEDQQFIPVYTKLGKLYIRQPTFADEIAAMRLKKDYEDLTEKEWKQVKGLFVTARLIIKPEVSFEDLMNQPQSIFIEVMKQVAEKLPSISIDIEVDEPTKKK